MNIKYGLQHPDPEIRAEYEASWKRVQEGRYTESLCFDVRQPWKNSAPFRAYWHVKEQIKMHCRVAWRKVFPYRGTFK